MNQELTVKEKKKFLLRRVEGKSRGKRRERKRKKEKREKIIKKEKSERMFQQIVIECEWWYHELLIVEGFRSLCTETTNF
jgi:hypothetical protein